ncbi:MAG: SLBB domain-containing protein [Leptolyngbyaceae cyanobacterium MO_188.B28]|nr:SLBB domain-containing protein [Leptolyngbyaceae cyanobacterium MO_188.B28]
MAEAIEEDDKDRSVINDSTPVQSLPSVLETSDPTISGATLNDLMTPRVDNLSPRILDETYRLGAGDLIHLDVFNVPEYSGEHQILADGSLNLPMVGKFSVGGMNLNQAEEAIARQYTPLVRHSVVTLRLLQPRPLQVAMAGEVNQPGVYTLSLTDSRQFPTVVDALKAAGGMTQTADLRQIQLQRPQAAGPPLLTTVDLWELLQNGDLSQNPALQDGDTLFIPTAAQTSLVETHQLATANVIADPNQTLNITVVGQVLRPGPHQVGPSAGSGAQHPTVTQAIQTAGGITPTADIRRIQVRRLTRSGPEQVIDIDLWALLQTGDRYQDIPLQQGDTVFIPTVAALNPTESTQLAAASFSPDQIQVNVVGEVERPGAVQVQPNTPLNQALLAAGGFNTRAQRTSVELVRLHADGAVSRREIKVDLAQNVNEETNPVLQNNDVVIVKRSNLASVTDGVRQILSPLNAIFGIQGLLNLF